MKLVVVSQRVDDIVQRNERRDALDQRLCAFLLSAGFLAVPIPNTLVGGAPASGNVLHAWLDAISPRALVLSGGNDIGSCPDRDLTEGGLLDYASQKELPVLGLCRGMQMIGVWAGAGLRSKDGHVRVRHTLAGDITGEVNSYHNNVLSECPTGFQVTARSEDREIEAFRHRSWPWEGWMWHPEREETFHERDLQRLTKLFST